MPREITKEGHKGIETFIGVQFMLWTEDMVRDIVEFGDENVQKMSSKDIAEQIFDSVQHQMHGLDEDVEKMLVKWIEEYRSL